MLDCYRANWNNRLFRGYFQRGRLQHCQLRRHLRRLDRVRVDQIVAY